MKRVLILLAILAGFAMTSDSASALWGRRAYYRGYYRPSYAYRPYVYGPGYYRSYYRPYYYGPAVGYGVY